MAFSCEKEESQKTREERKVSFYPGLGIAAAIWMVASFFSRGGPNYLTLLWNNLFGETKLASALDTTKILIRFTLTFLVCKAFSFYIFMRTEDIETDADNPGMVEAKPNEPGEREEI